jgi:hypothetical protein
MYDCDTHCKTGLSGCSLELSKINNPLMPGWVPYIIKLRYSQWWWVSVVDLRCLFFFFNITVPMLSNILWTFSSRILEKRNPLGCVFISQVYLHVIYFTFGKNILQIIPFTLSVMVHDKICSLTLGRGRASRLGLCGFSFFNNQGKLLYVAAGFRKSKSTAVKNWKA